MSRCSRAAGAHEGLPREHGELRATAIVGIAPGCGAPCRRGRHQWRHPRVQRRARGTRGGTTPWDSRSQRTGPGAAAATRASGLAAHRNITACRTASPRGPAWTVSNLRPRSNASSAPTFFSRRHPTPGPWPPSVTMSKYSAISLKPTLNRLTSLRAFAAFGVLAYHLGRQKVWNPLGIANDGYVGVGFFFVLSGFVLVWAHPAIDTAWRFYRRRFARVYPAHFVMLCVAAVVPVAGHRDVASGVASLSLSQAWLVPDHDLAFGMNSVSWSLSCEAGFYACFPFVLAWLLHSSQATRWRIAFLWFAATALITVVSAGIHQGEQIVAANPILRSSEFTLGVVAALAVKDGWRPKWSLASAAVVTITIYTIASVTDLPGQLPNTVLAGPFVAVVVAAAASDLSGPSSWLTSRWLIYAGEISFAFYLVHHLVIVNLISEVDLSGPVGAIICLLASLIAAMALHHGVELPMQRRLRGRPLRAEAGASEAALSDTTPFPPSGKVY